MDDVTRFIRFLSFRSCRLGWFLQVLSLLLFVKLHEIRHKDGIWRYINLYYFFSFNTKLAPGQQTPLLRSPHDDDNSCVPQLANTYRVQPHQHKPSHHASLPSTVRPTVLCKGPQQRPSCTKWSTSIHTVLPDLQIPPLPTTSTPLHSPVRACAATSVGVKDITSQSCCRDSRSARSSNGLQLPSPCHAPSRAASPVPAASRPYDDAMSACHAMSGTLSTFPSAFISQPSHTMTASPFSQKKKKG